MPAAKSANPMLIVIVTSSLRTEDHRSAAAWKPARTSSVIEVVSTKLKMGAAMAAALHRDTRNAARRSMLRPV
jgi:hypothetical protein